MENLLAGIMGLLVGLWNWTVHLNGGLQVVLVLAAVTMAGVCAIVAKRMRDPMMVETGGGVAGRTIIVIIAYVLGVAFALIALLGLAAVFAPLLGFIRPCREPHAPAAPDGARPFHVSEHRSGNDERSRDQDRRGPLAVRRRTANRHGHGQGRIPVASSHGRKGRGPIRTAGIMEKPPIGINR